MEEESENCINRKIHEDEEPKDELETQEVISHVSLRQFCAPEHDEAGLPLNCKRDSLALMSVYRYARKIKSFLGWENIIEESELEENNQTSTSQNWCLKGESSSLNGETSNKTKENKNGEILTANQIFHESNDRIYLDSKRTSSYLDDISEHTLERYYRSLTDLNDKFEEESDSDIGDEIIGDISHQKIFRSEVNIIVEDCRNNIEALPSTGETNLTVESNIGIMDESLAQENGITDDGLILKDAESILNGESDTVPSSPEIKYSNASDECAKEIILENIDESNVSDVKGDKKYVKDSYDEFKSENVVNRNDSKKGNDKEHFILVKDGLKGYLHKEVLDNNAKQNADDKEIAGRNKEGKRNGWTENNAHSSEVLRKSLVDNVDKLADHFVKGKQSNNANLSKTGKSLKAHIHYENEIAKQPLSKDAMYSKNQVLSRKDSISSEETECGFGVFRPRCLQPFATVKVYVILYSIIGVLHGSYYSYLIGTLSTLEKRYAFKSKISGAIMVADEATPLLLGVIIGYYAGKANRPRMIALGMLLSAACCFCSSLPYFIYGPVQYTTIQNVQNQIGPKFCDPDSEKDSCGFEDRPPTLPAVLFMVLGSFLKGFGNLAYYAIGLAYLDDNSNKKTTPIYLAIALALRLLGPLLGFLMSSVFLKLYENPADDPGYGPDDPRWVGAWWIGFFLQGVLLVIFTLPIALFPRRLPGQRRVEESTTSAGEDGLKQICLGLFSALKRLGTNPVFILLIVNTNMKIFGHFGHSIMLPKYMENQFRLSASEASLYSGATSVTFVMLATIFGGYLIWKFRPRIKVLLAGMIISEILLCVGFLILIIPRCQTIDMMNFGMNDEGLMLNSACNQMCDCSTTSYTPFCGPDGATYFSPCYAGCTQEIISTTSSKNHKEFRNCSCLSTPVDLHLVPTISEGVCPDENCWSQALAYLIIYFIVLTVSNTFTVAHSMILLRSVHPNDKSIALGTFETFICLFGFIPFPITFGALVDSACLIWEKSCGETGNCWFYDMSKYSYLLHGVGALFCSFSVLCLIGLFFLSSRVRDLYMDEDEEKNYVDIKLDTVSGSVTKL